MHYISYWGGRNHIVFVGDSRIRDQYYQFKSMLNNDAADTNSRAHEDLSFTDDKIKLKVVGFYHVNEHIEKI